MKVLEQRAQTGAREDATALKAVGNLLQALNRSAIKYCHWKSNVRLERSLRGQTDLDLLVDRAHIPGFRQLLKEHDVKRVLAPPGKRYPGIEDYLGFDSSTGTLFHLHVHYQLVLGEQFVKNYCLPLEDLFLNSVRLHQGVNIPAPELELIVLSLRALLKYRDRDAIKDVLTIRSPGIPAHILDEIHWLLGQTSIQDVSHVLAGIQDMIPRDVVLEFLQTVIASPRDGHTLYHLRQKARRALRVYQRQDRFFAVLTYFREWWRRRKSLLQFRPGRAMTLPGAGLTLALVGVDGAGKTTLCQELHGWLDGKIDVNLYYLGSKQPSRLTRWLYQSFRIARRGHRTISGLLGESNVLSSSMESVRQILLYGHYLSVGYDRYRRYLEGRRRARTGSIVIFDRFPLEAPLDGPEIHVAANGHRGAAAKAFSRWEQKLYRKFEMPDLLVVLDVSPEMSVQRKPDHRAEVIEAKNQVLHALAAGIKPEPPLGNWARVNADLPLEMVLYQLRRLVWTAS